MQAPMNRGQTDFRTALPASVARSAGVRWAIAGALLLLSACGGGGGTPGDTEAPTVALSAAPGTVAEGGSVTLTATATDNVGVSKVVFKDGAVVVGEDTALPYTLSVTLAAGSSGVHTYTAQAFDAAGNTGVSAGQAVTVTPAAAQAGVWDTSTWDNAQFQ